MEQDYKLISDLWQFWKSHYTAPDWNDDNGWEQLLKDANTFWHEHGDSKICQALVIAIVKELERRGKE